MAEQRIAGRYAKSLLDLAVETNQLEAIYNDMLLVESACKNSRDFQLMLESPIIRTDKKEAIIEEVFRGKLSPLTSQFLNIITQKSREAHIFEIATAFVMQYRTLSGVTTATVKSTITLDDAARAKVKAILQNAGYANVQLVEEVDAELIGGFILRIGDRQIDTSIKSEINKLKQGFKHNLYEETF